MMNIALRQGRLLSDTDGAEAPSVAVISESLARRYFPGTNPLGAHIKVGEMDSPRAWMTIVGVVNDIHYSWISKDDVPTIYGPFRQAPPYYTTIALALASVGVFGVMSYSVSERAHEIGIRMSLGAQTGDILRMVLRSGMTLTVLGLAIGLPIAFALARALAALLFGVEATDPFSFIGLPLLLAAVAALACYLPARRAARLDPLKALRYE